MLLHDVHFETSMLRKSRLAVRTLVRLLTRVRELVTFEMEAVSKSLSANVAREGSLASMRPEMPSELGDLDRGVLAKSALEGLLVRVFVSSMTSQLTRSNEGHFAVRFWTFVRFHAKMCVYMIAE